jgi:virginiamycin B lyase
VITEFPTGLTFNAKTLGIALGPDGNLWFTEPFYGLGRITTSGVVTNFSDGFSANAFPTEIAAGPDGALWFTEPNLSRIGRLTTFLADIIFADGFDCP